MAAARNRIHIAGKIIDGETADANITSATLSIEGVRNVSLHMVSASATRAGNIKVYTSNDNTNWALVTFEDATSQIDVTASTALNEMVDLYAVAGRFLRCVYTSSSGTGTLTITACPKHD